MENTKVVAPISICRDALVAFGDNCRIGAGFKVHGNGSVQIRDNCDIAPEVEIFTSSNKPKSSDQPAGAVEKFTVVVNQGTWIGERTILLGNVEIGNGCVIEPNSFLTQSVNENVKISSISNISMQELR